MTRSGGAIRLVRKAEVFKHVKGFQGKRKNCFTVAVRAYERSMQHNYIGRKEKKRDMRKMWISRIGNATSEHGLPYSQFMHGLVKADIRLNRKVLSEIAIHEPMSFAALVEAAKRFIGWASPKAQEQQQQQ
eukprot:m.132083 g.132083  ORF g.132083 m.132083 type:complete len:131 (-) comp13085_c0_seq3:969-1361(-)